MPKAGCTHLTCLFPLSGWSGAGGLRWVILGKCLSSTAGGGQTPLAGCASQSQSQSQPVAVSSIASDTILISALISLSLSISRAARPKVKIASSADDMSSRAPARMWANVCSRDVNGQQSSMSRPLVLYGSLNTAGAWPKGGPVGWRGVSKGRKATASAGTTGTWHRALARPRLFTPPTRLINEERRRRTDEQRWGRGEKRDGYQGQKCRGRSLEREKEWGREREDRKSITALRRSELTFRTLRWRSCR